MGVNHWLLQPICCSIAFMSRSNKGADISRSVRRHLIAENKFVSLDNGVRWIHVERVLKCEVK
jgi:hypothetical protein